MMFFIMFALLLFRLLNYFFDYLLVYDFLSHRLLLADIFELSVVILGLKRINHLLIAKVLKGSFTSTSR